MNKIRIEKHRKGGGSDLSYYTMQIEQIAKTQRLLKVLDVIADGDIIEEIRVHTGLDLLEQYTCDRCVPMGRAMIIEVRLADETQPELPLFSRLRQFLDNLPGSTI